MAELSFKQKLKAAKAKGVDVRKDRGEFLWFCPDRCWLGYFETAQAAWKAAFVWCGLEIQVEAPKANTTTKEWEPMPYRAPFIPLMS